MSEIHVQARKKSFLSSKHTHIPIFHEHFCFHGKNSVFLDSGQKHGGKHSFATPTPHTFDYALVASLCK
jgi:hypothetical protein